MEDYLYKYDITVSSICAQRVLKDISELAREQHDSSETAVSALLNYQLYLDQPPNISLQNHICILGTDFVSDTNHTTSGGVVILK